MPLNDTDKAWVRQEIQSAHKRKGLGILAGFIKDWGGTGAAVTILVIFFTQWSGYVEFRTHTQDQLGQIEKDITSIRVKIQVSLPQSEFQATLPELKDSLKSAKNKNLKFDSQTLTTIGQKLHDTPKSAPDFWPTVSEFVGYRSFLSGKDIASLESLPLCSGPYSDSFAQGVARDGTNVGPRLPVRFQERNCKVILDNIEAANTTYMNCLVMYSGGPIKKLADVTFQDCVFEFSISVSPPPEGQHVGEILLASNNLSSVYLP